jgi:5,10-methylenetetrahydrofolate reductase
MTFADRLRHFPIVLEVVPPHRRASETTVRKFARRVHAAARSIPHLDAINLPEILDENHAGHPYYRHLGPRQAARLLRDDLDVEPIVNKVVVHLKGAAEYEAWVQESLEAYGLRNFVNVGGANSRVPYPGPSVPEANGMLRAAAADRRDVALGNIAIPERAGEVERLMEKTRVGSQFFTTQVLFEPGPAADLLRRYGEACARAGLEPATVLLSVAPVTDYWDVEFLVWLGATVSPATEERLLAVREEPGLASFEVARSVFATLLRAVAASRHPVPLGVNVEEISTHNFELAVRMAKEIPEWKGA